MKQIITKKHLVVILVLTLPFSIPLTQTVRAHSGHHDETSNTKHEESTNTAGCTDSQKAVLDTLHRITATRQSQITHITEISEMVKAFYVKNKLSISNYDTLIKDTESKKSTASSRLDSAKSSASLDCKSSDLKIDIQNFKTKRLEAVNAIHAYKESVRAFVNAVQSVTKEEAHS